MSSKNDVLLRKAASYEKLALYGNSDDFLSAIAQTYALPNDSQIKASLTNIVNAINTWRRQYGETVSGQAYKNIPATMNQSFTSLENASRYNTYDLSLLKLISAHLLRLSQTSSISDDDAKNVWSMTITRPALALNQKISSNINSLDSGNTVAPEQDQGPTQNLGLKTLTPEAYKEVSSPKMTSEQFTKQLIGTVNMFIKQMGPQTSALDPKRDAVAKQIDNNVFSQLLKTYQAGSVDNPYISDEERSLAQQIKDVASKFINNFSAQAPSLINAVKIQST